MLRTVIVPPAEEPLSLMAAKAYLQVGHDAEDDLIGTLLAGGRAHVENSLDLALVTQTVEVSILTSSIDQGGCSLKPGPVTQLFSVVQESDGGSSDDITHLFELRGQTLSLRTGESLAVLSGCSVLRVRFQAGFGSASDVPDDLQLALRFLLGQSYRNRDGLFQADALTNIDDLLAPYRDARL